MKLPLLLHTAPKILAGPVVMLEKGNWTIESNHRDSEVRIALKSDILPLFPSMNMDLSLTEDTPISANINTIGSEKEITIFVSRTK
jgi:hypothetical protein